MRWRVRACRLKTDAYASLCTHEGAASFSRRPHVKVFSVPNTYSSFLTPSMRVHLHVYTPHTLSPSTSLQPRMKMTTPTRRLKNSSSGWTMQIYTCWLPGYKLASDVKKINFEWRVSGLKALRITSRVGLHLFTVILFFKWTILMLDLYYNHLDHVMFGFFKIIFQFVELKVWNFLWQHLIPEPTVNGWHKFAGFLWDRVDHTFQKHIHRLFPKWCNKQMLAIIAALLHITA